MASLTSSSNWKDESSHPIPFKFQPHTRMFSSGLKMATREHVPFWNNSKKTKVMMLPHQQFFVSIAQLRTQYSLSSTSNGIDDYLMRIILQYMHAIGSVVVVDDNTVCTDPTIIPKIVANFISPEEVRIKLFKERNIAILDEGNIKCLLNIAGSDER